MGKPVKTKKSKLSTDDYVNFFRCIDDEQVRMAYDRIYEQFCSQLFVSSSVVDDEQHLLTVQSSELCARLFWQYDLCNTSKDMQRVLALHRIFIKINRKHLNQHDSHKLAVFVQQHKLTNKFLFQNGEILAILERMNMHRQMAYSWCELRRKVVAWADITSQAHYTKKNAQNIDVNNAEIENAACRTYNEMQLYQLDKQPLQAIGAWDWMQEFSFS